MLHLLTDLAMTSVVGGDVVVTTPGGSATLPQTPGLAPALNAVLFQNPNATFIGPTSAQLQTPGGPTPITLSLA